MVRPSYFGFNHETAANNTFQNNDNASHEQIRQSARNEYDSLVALLKKNGINIISYSENPNSQLTDSIFPN
ncbi:MAG: arginine deiminase-related protein, partial [Saprospiraceae bacterium]|nr:arginine deiminase-related protein [Saprospiraceae bacterium]